MPGSLVSIQHSHSLQVPEPLLTAREERPTYLEAVVATQALRPRARRLEQAALAPQALAVVAVVAAVAGPTPVEAVVAPQRAIVVEAVREAPPMAPQVSPRSSTQMPTTPTMTAPSRSPTRWSMHPWS